jgi:NAD(P)-dependent dehydrogenase (short-subunit alcohol dehydrogenase family)
MAVTLEGRVAVVTGAGRGIGRATAIELARLGAAVVVNDIGTAIDGSGRDARHADEVVAEIEARGGRAVASHDSVADFESARRIIDTATTQLGGIDILVNNAGLSAGSPVWEQDPELFERVGASHVGGTFYCTRHAVPTMKQKRWGRIVNLVSRSGIVGVAGNIAYGTAKGGVFGFTNAASRDLAPFGVTVNAVNPSSTETRMVMGAVEHGRRVGGEAGRRAENLLAVLQQPEEVAVLIAYLCSEEAAGVTGQVFLVRKSEIGLFQPLTVTQTTSKDGRWSVDELAEAIPKLDLHPLDTPY